MEKVSIITRCMNREKHLCHSLPRMLAQTYQNLEVVVVNYNSSKSLSLLLYQFPELKAGKLKEVRAGKDSFHHAHAWNVGIKESSGDILIFCDADILINTALVSIIVNRMRGNKKMFARSMDVAHNDLSGFLCARREDVIAIGGYNEQLLGWGFEDGDMRLRLILYGCDYLGLNLSGMVAVIEHAEQERTGECVKHMEDKVKNRDLNGCRSMLSRLHSAYRANVGVEWGNY